ncbi:hypothetical protein ACFQ5N_01055 [Lutibacter holmesii]|uniref:Uncharacterized protein n=1 Tax=Lutibacter holmesii TaxID=1137985 RepID=A0ABW3WKZ7_9FLAO
MAHNQNVEIYFKENIREAIFGYKINDLDSNASYDRFSDCDANYSIMDEINNVFLDSDLIDRGEGDTSYLLTPDSSCIKTADYFYPDSDQFWIENNESEFDFGKIELPINKILIQKDYCKFMIYEEKELKKHISPELFKDFSTFYKLLLEEFQEMEIELEVFKRDDTYISCINSMNGTYTETNKFVLLDTSNLDISLEDLKAMLIESFNMETEKVDSIFLN